MLYNVTNVLTLLQGSGALRDDTVEGVGGELMLKECVSAVAFEAWRLETPEDEQREVES